MNPGDGASLPADPLGRVTLPQPDLARQIDSNDDVATFAEGSTNHAPVKPPALAGRQQQGCYYWPEREVMMTINFADVKMPPLVEPPTVAAKVGLKSN